MKDLVDRLVIKAGVMEMGENIAWGSDTSLMREAADELKTLRTEHLEQSRLLGMSGERECALLGEIERKDKALRVALDALEYMMVTSERRLELGIPEKALDTINEALK